MTTMQKVRMMQKTRCTWDAHQRSVRQPAVKSPGRRQGWRHMLLATPVGQLSWYPAVHATAQQWSRRLQQMALSVLRPHLPHCQCF